MIQGPVQFDMMQGNFEARGDPIQRAYLLQQEEREFIRRQIHRSAAAIRSLPGTWMRSETHPELLAEPRALFHGPHCPSVSSASDVR